MKKIFWYIFPAVILLTFLAMFSVGWYSAVEIENFYVEKVHSQLRARALAMNQLLRAVDDSTRLARALQEFSDSTGTRMTLIDSAGLVLFDSREDPRQMDNHGAREEIVLARENGLGTTLRYSITLDKLMMYLALQTKKSGAQFFVRTSLPVHNVQSALRKLFVDMWIGGLFIAFIGVFIAWAISRKVVLPLKHLEIGAQLFASGDLSKKLPEKSWFEMRSLAKSMNHMARELDRKIRSVVKAKNETEAVFSSMVEGVVAVDRDGKILRCNRAFRKLAEVGKDAPIQGKILQEVIRNSKLPTILEGIAQSGSSVEEDLELFRRDMQQCVLKVAGTVLLDAEDREIGFLLVFNDVTQLRRLEGMRTDFVSNVSHELKTPITSIRGYVETLQNGALYEKENAEKFLEIIRRQSDRMNTLIGDLLTLSRIEGMEEDSEEFGEKLDPKQLVASIAFALESERSKKEITLDLCCGESMYFRGNRNLLEMALVNLVGNALRYAPAQSLVRLSCYRKEEHMVFSVEDNGPGIEAHHLGRLFERFYRVDKARSREMGGTGLGLSIVKHIALCHGGRVEVESKVGKGSKFSIAVPIEF